MGSTPTPSEYSLGLQTTSKSELSGADEEGSPSKLRKEQEGGESDTSAPEAEHGSHTEAAEGEEEAPPTQQVGSPEQGGSSEAAATPQPAAGPEHAAAAKAVEDDHVDMISCLLGEEPDDEQAEREKGWEFVTINISPTDQQQLPVASKLAHILPSGQAVIYTVPPPPIKSIRLK